MAPVSYLVLFIFSHLSLLCFARGENRFNPPCPPFTCGILGQIAFPFSNRENPECGLFRVYDCNQLPKIQLGKDGPRFHIFSILQDNTIVLYDLQLHQFRLHDLQLQPSRKYPNTQCSEFIKNLTLPTSPFFSFEIPLNRTLFKCPNNNYNITKNFCLLCNDSKYSIYDNFSHYSSPGNGDNTRSPTVLPNCSQIHLLSNKARKGVEFLNLFTGGFFLKVSVEEECSECYHRGGQCLSDNKENFHCSKGQTGIYNSGNGKLKLQIGLGVGVGGGVLLISVLSICFIRIRKKQKYASRNLQSANTSGTSSKSDLETGTVYFGVPIFSYSDLADATDNFNHEKELGGGGFGKVYHGKLRDGREVAVKRLYEHNYRRVEQFMNEIEILTCLRHKNLVSLYGCTSRHSQGLLLVYEFVPNGTVADHLHGVRARSGLLSWPVRMNIAVETASALAYLHASDIIHRDVKTNNILLDNNFSVKVADFGLSRLFPTDVTHISTAPQGTPGYVDPEYHQCYQLTDKSDVYSFGVVLIELISSMPAVDITRHRHEINLANLAMNKIQKCEFDELIDPCLGYDSDEEVRRMTTSVAELAFLCLQQNNDMRPSMDVVQEELERIQNGESKYDNQKEKQDDVENLKSKQPPSPPHCDEVSLLKNIRFSSSPISVTEKWVSHNSTPNVSS